MESSVLREMFNAVFAGKEIPQHDCIFERNTKLTFFRFFFLSANRLLETADSLQLCIQLCLSRH